MMYVIADIEWVESSTTLLFPTQISALKVDSDWNEVAWFSSFIHPPHGHRYDPKHVAYNGGTSKDFEAAKEAYNVFLEFYMWLNADDVLLWWFDGSDEVFRSLSKEFLGCIEQHKSVVVTDYIRAFISGHTCAVGSQYSVAGYLRIPTHTGKKHYSYNDVMIAYKVLGKLRFPQEKFQHPPEIEKILPVPMHSFSKFAYYYDPQTNQIHKNTCGKLIGIKTSAVGYPSLAKALRKNYKPCDCCKVEYRQALKERNIDIISRTEHNYIYSPDSDVFHKRNCRLILNAHRIMGTHTYEAVLRTGKMPCKVCKPSHNDWQSSEWITPRKVKPNSVQSILKKETKNNIISHDELRAIRRQKVAAKERADKLREGLSQTELNNIYALTQPRYAFWAAKGYKNFHLRTCPILANISHLRGFSAYSEARKAGFIPCRKCKPSPKHDLKISVPIYNQIRKNENISDLYILCEDTGYEYAIEGDLFCLETPVGKWRIHTKSNPVKIEHINLTVKPVARKYHFQPRVFLSLIDAFVYIKRHDNNLIEANQGKSEKQNKVSTR